jgi:hypothetical protein
MLIYRRTPEEIEQIALDALNKTDIKNNGEGSPSLGIVKAINEMIGILYDSLDTNIDAATFSKAEQGFVDLIGELFNCPRNYGETDEEYKYRISNQVSIVASANKTSIEFATYNIENVTKVVLVPYTHGIGSFSAYVITDTMLVGNDLDSVLSTVQEKVDTVAAYGIRTYVVAPKPLTVSMNVNVIFKQGTSSTIQSTVRSDVARNIKAYVDALDMNEGLVVAEIIDTIMDLNSAIYDVAINSITINNKAIVVNNYTPHSYEKLYVPSTSYITVG